MPPLPDAPPPQCRDLADIRAAHAVIAPHIHRTPGPDLHHAEPRARRGDLLQVQNFQKIGAFKARGATYAVLSARGEAVRGGVVRRTPRATTPPPSPAPPSLRGVPGYIVMPSNAPRVKSDSVRRYGGQITFCEPNLAAREAAAARLQTRDGRASSSTPSTTTRSSPARAPQRSNCWRTCPTWRPSPRPWGGGLMSGTSIAASELRPGIRIWGTEPALADDAARSLETGELQPPADSSTIADGLRTGLSERTFDILRTRLEGIAQRRRTSFWPPCSWSGRR